MSKVITIAGSGPSTELVKHVDVATKKRSVPSDYVFCRFHFNHKGDEPLMLYYRRCRCGRCEACQADFYCDSGRWNAYYRQFVREKRPPQKSKPSTGLCAVFGVVERWNPRTVGLIGYDYILDGNTDWEHDAIAELHCILSLVNIRDLRSGQLIRRRT